MRARREQHASNRPESGARSDVEAGDDVYVHHERGPCCARVVAHGKHGCTVEIDGKQHKVRWARVLGHKRRAPQKFAVVDEGEDGMLVEDSRGRRRFIHVPNASREDPMVVKAQRPMLLFVKSESGDGPIANRPGLTQKKITDRTGRQQTKWVRVDKGESKGERRGGQEEDAVGAAQGYGTHNLQAGDKVSFKAGDFEGSGTIVGEPGADGAHVKDASGRVHQVRWSEITGHDKNGGKAKPEVQQEVRGEQKPISPERFQASEYAKQHDDPDVTPEQILAHFPPDTADKIKAVQERLKSVEQTIDRFKRGDEYAEQRQKLHHQILYEGRHVPREDGKTEFRPAFLSPERVRAATPPEGEAPTLVMLGGRGGSGKSWFKGRVYDPDKAIVVDPDSIKEMMPEYEGWNAHQVHEESGDLTDMIIREAMDLGLNVVLDATMKTAKNALATIRAFKDAGYRIEAHYMHLPRHEAAKRAVQRFLGKTQRYVPVEVVLANTSNEDTFDRVRELADKWSFRDNNVPYGADPILVSESEGEATGAPAQEVSEDPGLRKSELSPIIMLWRAR